jgi:hypothetical protein
MSIYSAGHAGSVSMEIMNCEFGMAKQEAVTVLFVPLVIPGISRRSLEIR